jgi:hypothetical protein
MSIHKLVEFMKGKHWIIIFILISASFGIYNGLSSLAKDSINDNWQTKDRHLLVEKCIKDAGETSLKHPNLTKEYCGCSILQIQERFSKSEYLAISKYPIDAQMKKLFLVIENCQTQLLEKIRIKETNK